VSKHKRSIFLQGKAGRSKAVCSATPTGILGSTDKKAGRPKGGICEAKSAERVNNDLSAQLSVTAVSASENTG